MSRVTKWKLEKTKVKVVFRLQFQANYIPQNGWNNLLISLIPADSGKATAKTNKAAVRNGTCKWSDPIYESTRLLQNTTTKQYEDKLYKIVVAMGTSRLNILGEANINLCDYVDALKPTTVALPLEGSESGAILNVTVQLLTSKTGFREFEQQREISDRGIQTNSDHDSGKLSTPGQAAVSRSTKVSPRVTSKSEPKELPSLVEESGFIEGHAESAAGFDGSSNTSDSLGAEKHDNPHNHENDLGGISSSQRPTRGQGPPDHHFMVQHNTDWINHSSADSSVDSEVAIVYEENSQLRRALEAANLTIQDFQQEIISLQKHAGDMAIETQKLTDQLHVEITSEHKLAKEVALLKSESLRFKGDIEWLKTIKINSVTPKTKSIDDHQHNLLQDLSMKWLNGLSIVEGKLIEVKNKVQLGFHEKDSMFVHSDLEGILSVLQNLKQGTRGSAYQANMEVTKGASTNADLIMSDTGLGAELCHPEGVLVPGLSIHGHGSQDATNALQGEMFKLLRELDESKSQQENLMGKMGQMECYYEALIQELEQNQKQILGELQNLRNEHSSCTYTILATKDQMEAMHQQMNDELLQLSAEKYSLDARNKELEKRVVSSETAMRRARVNYSVAVNQLQKNLEVLSSQVVSMYETNENLIQKAFETSQPLLQGCQETLSGELQAEDSYNEKFMVSPSHSTSLKNQLVGGDRLLENLRRSLTLQEDLYDKIQEELYEMQVANVHLDVFSVMLCQALHEATTDNRLAKEEMHEFAQRLGLSSKSIESLKQELQNAMDENLVLSEEKAVCVARCNDLASQNHALEANLQCVSDENCILSEKNRELESLVSECKNYESKYHDCEADKTKLEVLLEQVTAEKQHVTDEISSLHEELRTMKSEVSHISSSKEALQKILDHLQIRMETLLDPSNEDCDALASCGKIDITNMESEEAVNIMLRFEELHHNFNRRVLQLTKNKEDLLNEHDTAQLSLASAKSEIETLKQTFHSEMSQMVGKINTSSALVAKLQTDLEVMDCRFKVSSEAEEKYTQMAAALLTDFAKIEAGLQELTSQNSNLADEIIALASISGDLEQNKSTIDKITQENVNLVALLENKTDEIDKLGLELDESRRTVRCLQDEFPLNRELREKLEGEVLTLKTQVKDNHELVFHIDQQKAEICHLQKQLSDMEFENSSIYHQLSYVGDCLKKSLEESSQLDFQLQDMHELLIAADVTNTVIVKQYRCHVDMLIQKLEYLNQYVEVANMKNINNEADCAKKSARLLSTLERSISESELCAALNKNLEHPNSAVISELVECKQRCAFLEDRFSKAEIEHKFEIEQLKCFLGCRQKEIDDLVMSNEELQIRLLVLEAKLKEANVQKNLLGEYKEELVKLQKQCGELTCKLSEQSLRNEEFKNLCIHLRELKDKAVAENLQAHEKRKSEGPATGMQESLRIAFVKEQYETKLQEVRYQLSLSKKHGEEMMWKLQDSFEELEKMKKGEASLLERNEELLLKIAELETELQTVVSDKHERFMAHDQLKAELDCLMTSLNHCKEEKEQLLASLQECIDEKSRLVDEVDLMKERMENFTTFMGSQEGKGHVSYVAQKDLNESENERALTVEDGEMNPSKHMQAANSTVANVQNEFRDEVRDATFVSEQLKAQNLRFSMDRLQKQLEKMRSENMLLPGDEDADESHSGEDLQHDEVHLEKVTKELGSMSSLYEDSSRHGNSLERVLALELELAESLQAKKKSSIQFQSSFLKLHSDEAAIFQSFRDINELIKDMLEMKGKYGAMESKLNEMHERYSQLSLQFAEVEGERQKLMMTLKNTRSSKRLQTRTP